MPLPRWLKSIAVAPVSAAVSDTTRAPMTVEPPSSTDADGIVGHVDVFTRADDAMGDDAQLSLDEFGIDAGE